MQANLLEMMVLLEKEFNYSIYQDSSVNGLQVEAKPHVSKIGAAVDFSDSAIFEAEKLGIDLLITHHGLLWEGSEPSSKPISGTHGSKIRALMQKQINLVGIHLPLDAHHIFGNNIIIAKEILELADLEPAIVYGSQKIGWKGGNSKNLDLDQLAELFSSKASTQTNPLILRFGPNTPKRVCVVSGAAADSLYHFKSENFDTLITGEPRQFAYHFCKENKINAIFAGHYATETFGVKALAEYLAKTFDLVWEFIDEPTGI